MVFEIDEPPVLCGTNLGMNPVEYLLVALSGCLTTSMIAYAAARGISGEVPRSDFTPFPLFSLLFRTPRLL